MSGLPPTSETRASNMSLGVTSPSPQPSKGQRVLACTLCQQRKVKCNRQFPCANCIKSRSQCVPAILVPRQRKRRFTERTLLDRLRKYEDLLRQNHVSFEPLHSTRREDFPQADNGDDSDDEQMENTGLDISTSSTTAKSEGGYDAKNVFHAMSRGFRDPEDDSDSSHDDLREKMVKGALNSEVDRDQHLLFGPRVLVVDLSTFHPNPVQIFRLWQIYTENVNILLKVTHTPSLQPRVIEAASDLTSVDATLEALMFGIYCTAVLSLTEENCQIIFGSSKEDLLSRYQSGCQQALWKCGFLRTSDRDCLTALFLYLISVKANTTPQSLSSMLGIAVRIAQRMGINNESALAKCTPFEAEMRRRLWWPLMLFDTRMAELAFSKILTLEPSWDCKIPLNVNDADLRPEMKAPPATRREPTDAIFAVARCELGDFVRHTSIHLDFQNPALKPLAKYAYDGLDFESGHLLRLEETIEDRYLKLCDQENPIHFMATWTTRALLAKYRILEQQLKLSSSLTRRVEAQYDAATASAIRMLECDTKIMASPLTKGYVWFNKINFPFPAYYQIAQDLRRRPTNDQAQQAWDCMSDSWEAWSSTYVSTDSPVFQLMAKIILQAWEACEVSSKPLGQTLMVPRIVSSIRHALAQTAETIQNSATEGTKNTMDMATNEFPTSTLISTPMPVGFSNHHLPYGMGTQNGYAWMRPDMSSSYGAPGQDSLDNHIDQIDWAGFGPWPGW